MNFECPKAAQAQASPLLKALSLPIKHREIVGPSSGYRHRWVLARAAEQQGICKVLVSTSLGVYVRLSTLMPGTPRVDPLGPQSKAESSFQSLQPAPSKDGKEFQFLLHLIKEETDRKADALA